MRKAVIMAKQRLQATVGRGNNIMNYDMKQPVLVEGRRIYNSSVLQEAEVCCYGLGC